MKRYITQTIAFFILFVPFFTDAATWQIDPDHSSFQFKIRHLTVSNVKGDFGKAKGVVTLDDKDISQLKVELIIDTSSVNTSHAKRDEHLRGPDFFDVVKYPTLTFISKKVIKVEFQVLFLFRSACTCSMLSPHCGFQIQQHLRLWKRI